jgi:hypothetical protein
MEDSKINSVELEEGIPELVRQRVEQLRQHHHLEF